MSRGMASSDALSPRDRIGLSAHYFFSYGALGFVFAFLPLFLKSRGLSLTEIGILGGAYAGVGAGVQVPISLFSDRLRRRKPLLTASCLLLAGSYLLYGRVVSFWGFLPLYIVGGVMVFTNTTLTNALLSDWTARGGSTAACYGVTRIWGSLGFISTLAIVSAVPRIVEGLNILPAAAALQTLSGVSISLVTEPREHVHVPKSLFTAIPRLLRNANLAVFLFAFLLFRISESASNSYLSLYIQSLKGSKGLIAIAFALAAVVEIPFMLWIGRASDRIGRRPPILVACLVMPIRMFLYSLLTNPTNVLYIQLLHGFTFSFMLVGSVAFVADLCPDDLRATGQGVLSMTGGLAMALGPLLGGTISEHTSLASLYWIMALVALVGALVFGLFVRESRPRLGASESVMGRR